METHGQILSPYSCLLVVWLNAAICFVLASRVFTADAVCLFTERSGGHVDHFDIAERVEMGQMASMFFNKGNYSSCLELLISPPVIQLPADATFISHV